MADFKHYSPVLLANEGNYCHDIQDPGGETYRGIARAYHTNWSGWPLIDAAKKQLGMQSPIARAKWPAVNKALAANTSLGASVMSFYKAEYWNPLGLDNVSCQCTAEQLADHGVNAGTTRPAKMLQYLLNTEFGANLVVDGQIGEQTIKALNKVNQADFYSRFVAMRRAFYCYRAGKFTPAEAQSLAAWHRFFQQDLHLTTDTRMQKFLASWLSRTQAPFMA